MIAARTAPWTVAADEAAAVARDRRFFGVDLTSIVRARRGCPGEVAATANVADVAASALNAAEVAATANVADVAASALNAAEVAATANVAASALKPAEIAETPLTLARSA